MNLCFYADLLLERYYLDDLDQLTKLELSLLWDEVLTGFKLLKIEKFDQLNLNRLFSLKPVNLRKLTKLYKLVTSRNDDSITLDTEGKGIPDGLNKGKLTCPDCPKSILKTFSSQSQIIHHQLEVHFCYNCPICNETKRGLGNTRMHLRKMHQKSADEARVLMPTDSEVVERVNGQRKPCSDHTPEQCIYCLKKYRTVQGLRHHCQSQHIQYQCPICKEVRRGLHKTRIHIAEVHAISKQQLLLIKLEECGRPDPINQPDQIIIHQPTGISEKQQQYLENRRRKAELKQNLGVAFPYKCEYCFKQFQKGSCKRDHVSSVHHKVRYECPACKLLLSHKHRVEEHLLKVHGVSKDRAQNIEFRTLYEQSGENEEVTVVKIEADEEDDDDINLKPVAKRTRI